MLKKYRTDSELGELQELPSMKKARPLVIGKELYRQVRVYLNAVQKHGGVVNKAIAIVVGTGTIHCNSN